MDSADGDTMPEVNIPCYGFFLGSEVRKEGEPLEVRACFDQSLVAVTFRPTAEDVEAAVSRTVSAARTTVALPTYERARILRRMAALLERRRDEVVRLLALEAGKPVKAGSVEVDRCIFNLDNASEEAQRIESEFIPLDLFPAASNRWALVRRFPLGSILAISPFNFPLNLVAHKVAPAIASGNSIVQKPASATPLCSLVLAEIAYGAGLPQDALSVLPCSGSEAEKLVRDDRFQLLTFTGSSEVGWRLKQLAGHKRVTLELGGNAGVIVNSDADLETAAARCASGGFTYSGQSCISVQRIFVQRSVFDRFAALLVDEVEGLAVGDPLNPETDVGPMITEADACRVETWVEEALQGGAEILTGGRRQDAIYLPTVLTRTQRGMKVNCEEVFGPLVTVEPFETVEEAISLVNASRFGLQAGIFTRDIKAVFTAYRDLEVGGVVANDVPTFRADHMPYGGVKDSGTGREGAKYAIEEMTERKTLVLTF